MKLINFNILAITAFILMFQPADGIAQQVHMYDQPLSADEMGRILFGSSPTRGITSPTRGINLNPTPNSEPSYSPPVTNSAPQINYAVSNEKTGIGFPIEFDLNSSEIKPGSRPFLYEVGKMMTSPDYHDKSLLIEGHTDARGSDQYNLYLSERRAHAISNFLIRNFGIHPSRLRPVGMGKYRPLPGRDPFDPVNRRVELYSASTN